MNPSTSSARCEDQSTAEELMDDWLFLSYRSLGPEVLEVSTDGQEAVDRGKLKSKLVSAWNSVKYGQFKLLYVCVCVIIAGPPYIKCLRIGNQKKSDLLTFLI